MSNNLLNRLKKAENHPVVLKEKQKKHIFFFRPHPSIISGEEKRFFKETKNLEDYHVMVITWFDENAKYTDEDIESLKSLARE